MKIFYVPSPHDEEQTLIVEHIESAFNTIHAIESELTRAERRCTCLDQSILAKAFRGELVPQDSNDEPASVLLERICAERAKREAEAKVAKKSIGKTTGRHSRKAKQQDSESVQLDLPEVE